MEKAMCAAGGDATTIEGVGGKQEAAPGPEWIRAEDAFVRIAFSGRWPGGGKPMHECFWVIDAVCLGAGYAN